MDHALGGDTAVRAAVTRLHRRTEQAIGERAAEPRHKSQREQPARAFARQSLPDNGHHPDQRRAGRRRAGAERGDPARRAGRHRPLGGNQARRTPIQQPDLGRPGVGVGRRQRADQRREPGRGRTRPPDEHQQRRRAPIRQRLRQIAPCPLLCLDDRRLGLPALPTVREGAGTDEEGDEQRGGHEPAPGEDRRAGQYRARDPAPAERATSIGQRADRPAGREPAEDSARGGQ